MRALVWFRGDLRTRDNPALYYACRDADRGVVGVFLVCAGQWAEHGWAPCKVEFVLRTLGELSAALDGLNVGLLIRSVDRFSGAAGELRGIAAEHGCGALYFNREYEYNERRRDGAVVEAFESEGRRVRAFDDQVLIPPGELRTGEGRYYTVFSPFRRAWVGAVQERGFSPLGAPAHQTERVTAPSPAPGAVEGFGRSGVPEGLWPAGEGAASERLEGFVSERIGSYGELRDYPGVDGTSRLSPYLTVGAVSTRACVHAAASSNGGKLDKGGKGATGWISELAWREFYRHVLVGYPRVSMGRAFRPETERVRWRDDPEGLAAWKEGRTGFPIVDAAMRQLLRGGWMHNRLRMISAMFLTKDLLIDWREGERHFMRHLIDGDLASNNGGWQWSASTGTDAAPYFRVFNPFTQSRRFDPGGAFIRAHVEELRGVEGDAVHDPGLLPDPARSRLDYPPPIVDHASARVRAVEAFKAAV